MCVRCILRKFSLRASPLKVKFQLAKYNFCSLALKPQVLAAIYDGPSEWAIELGPAKKFK